MEIDIIDNYKPMVYAFLNTLPDRITGKIKSLSEGEDIGNGQCALDGAISIGFTDNPVFDMELLGHEVGHIVGRKLKFLLSERVEKGISDYYGLVDFFSAYAIYGNELQSLGKTSREVLQNERDYLRLAIHYGERTPEMLENLYVKMRRFARKRGIRSDRRRRHFLHESLVPFEILEKHNLFRN